MDDEGYPPLRDQVQNLVTRAAALIATTPLTPGPVSAPPRDAASHADISRMLDELGEAEAQIAGVPTADDLMIRQLTMTSGALYATRCIRFGAAEDRDEALRLLRAGRACGGARTDVEVTAMLLHAVLLLPEGALNVERGALGALGPILAVGQQIMQGGGVVDDLREMQAVLNDVIAARPDDPRIGPLLMFARNLGSIMALVDNLSSGTPVTTDQLGEVIATLPPAPSQELADIADTLLDQGRLLERLTDRSEPEPIDPSEIDGDLAWERLATLLAVAVPGSLDPRELNDLIERFEHDGPNDAGSFGMAAMGRLISAMRSNSLAEMENVLEHVRAAVKNPAATETSWLPGTVLPAALATLGGAHGNRQDVAAALEVLRSAGPAAEPPPSDETAHSLGIVQTVFQRNLEFFQAVDIDDDEAMDALLSKAAAIGRTAQTATDTAFLEQVQAATMKLAVGIRRADADLLHQAENHLRRALECSFPAAVRPLLHSAVSATLVATALVERRPDVLDEAVERARGTLASTASTHDQHIHSRLALALALLARHHLGAQPVTSQALHDAIEELEQAERELDDRTSPTIAGTVRWTLADACHRRGDAGLGDDEHAVALALTSLRIVADDVLLQLGTEHGLQSARTGAHRGLQAAGWALDLGRVADAIESLELGRALVLRAAATSGTIPDRLRRADAAGLAEQWELSGSPAAADDDRFSVPSELRRRALDTLRQHEGPDSTREPAALPAPPRIAEQLAHAGIDALIYLLPETSGAIGEPGRAIVVTADGADAREVPLPGLTSSEQNPFATYLDTSAHRSIKLRDAGAAVTTTVTASRDLAPAADWEDSLDKLCQWAGSAVVDPLLAALPGTPTPDEPARVVLIPCGILGAVPWHAATLAVEPSVFGMSRPVRACDLLVVSYAASAGELLRSLARERVPSYDTRPVLVVDPTRSLRHAADEALTIRRAFMPHARLMGAVGGLQTAPGTPDDVLAAFTGRSGTAPASMVQISAHGTASTGPTTSRLVLADPGRPAAETAAASRAGVGPEHLTVAGVLDAARSGAAGVSPLVVLDCCETDLSNRDHDEALTLTTAFVARGASDVVGSRWAVDDWSTAVCMIVFHHHLATGEHSPADALRAAQRWMLGPARETIPALVPELLHGGTAPLHAVTSWAPFIHQGNARPAGTSRTSRNPSSRR